jgi:hypothetical protein
MSNPLSLGADIGVAVHNFAIGRAAETEAYCREASRSDTHFPKSQNCSPCVGQNTQRMIS